MNNEKIDALIECSDNLLDALNAIEMIDDEDDKLTEIYWEIKDCMSTIDKYLKELKQ
jgi:hypothetical protein